MCGFRQIHNYSVSHSAKLVINDFTGITHQGYYVVFDFIELKVFFKYSTASGLMSMAKTLASGLLFAMGMKGQHRQIGLLLFHLILPVMLRASVRLRPWAKVRLGNVYVVDRTLCELFPFFFAHKIFDSAQTVNAADCSDFGKDCFQVPVHF